MSLGSDQVHIPASELLRDPLTFIRLLDRHKVAYTFAPNFFLASLRDRLAASPNFVADLSQLKALISGGESNVVATCDMLTREFRRSCSIRGEVIRPGFGMTETCAGSIYSRDCPSSDLVRGVEFANLGTCTPGIQMRVMDTEKQVVAANGEVGQLQITGPVVFDEYFNNPEATADAFTRDGWFITGDLAWLDKQAGSLNLAGRTKDTIIVNGVNWSATEIETAIEEEGIPGLVPSFTVAFPHRAAGSSTESIAVVYSPAYAADDHHVRFETATAVARTVALMTGRKPARLIPLPQEMLEKSSLGKISRAKVRTALESGDYANLEQQDTENLDRYREARWRRADTPTEKLVQGKVAEVLEMPAEEINLNASIFDLGISSFNLIYLKNIIQDAIDNNKTDIPMSIFLTE